MKRLGLVLTATFAIAALVVGTGTAGDTKGPPCANITGSGDTDFYDPTFTPNLHWTFVLASSSCSSVTYTLDIYNKAGTTLLVNDLQPSSTVGNTVTFNYTFASGAPTDGVCLYGETQHRGRVADRALDDGSCFAVDVGSGAGGSGFS